MKKIIIGLFAVVLLLSTAACNPSARRAGSKALKEDVIPAVKKANRAHKAQELSREIDQWNNDDD